MGRDAPAGSYGQALLCALPAGWLLNRHRVCGRSHAADTRSASAWIRTRQPPWRTRGIEAPRGRRRYRPGRRSAAVCRLGSGRGDSSLGLGSRACLTRGCRAADQERRGDEDHGEQADGDPLEHRRCEPGPPTGGQPRARPAGACGGTHGAHHALHAHAASVANASAVMMGVAAVAREAGGGDASDERGREAGRHRDAGQERDRADERAMTGSAMSSEFSASVVETPACVSTRISGSDAPT